MFLASCLLFVLSGLGMVDDFWHGCFVVATAVCVVLAFWFPVWLLLVAIFLVICCGLILLVLLFCI